MLQNIEKQLKEKPFATVSKWVGTITGIIAIIYFAGDVVKYADDMVVSPEELKGSEQRIIQSVREEAVLTRSAILTILEERKVELRKNMQEHEAAGRTVQAQEVLDELLRLKQQIIEIRDAQ
jgi:hypothetical protein